ncbi:SDR family oxidoreductase [Patescibacteria group bacterium]|nr:SDR family oxidoreductase [Patescibacteria group bacterium]
MNTNANCTAFVTGASTGIGRAIAQRLANDGYYVYLQGRNKNDLSETQSLIAKKGGGSELLLGDLKDRAYVTELGDFLRSKIDRLNVIVYAAGVWHNENEVFAGVPLADTTVQQIEEVMEVGIIAPMLLSKALLPLMIPFKQGKILCISGTFATGGAGWLHYYVSKLALEQLTVGLAQELREHEIQVNCISPSDTDTPALRRFFPEDAETAIKPEEVADLASYLCSPRADNITGQIIVVKNKSVH